MRLGIRLLFAFFLINGLAAFFVLRVFMAEIKPSVRKVTEDTLVETAYLLAAQASDDLADGKLGSGSGSSRFAQQVQAAFQQPLRVWIWDTRKAALDLRVTVTNAQGRIPALFPAGVAMVRGTYRVTFKTGKWFAEHKSPTFFPEIPVIFMADGSVPHYHVPLLLSPYGYSTYRGN